MLDRDGTCCLQVCLDFCWHSYRRINIWIYSASERDPITICHGKSGDWLEELQWRRSLAKAFRELRRSEHVKAALEVAAPGLMATWRMSYRRFFLPVSRIALAFCLGGWMEGVRMHRVKICDPKPWSRQILILHSSIQWAVFSACRVTSHQTWLSEEKTMAAEVWYCDALGQGHGWDWEMQHKPQTWKQYDYKWAQWYVPWTLNKTGTHPNLVFQDSKLWRCQGFWYIWMTGGQGGCRKGSNSGGRGPVTYVEFLKEV